MKTVINLVHDSHNSYPQYENIEFSHDDDSDRVQIELGDRLVSIKYSEFIAMMKSFEVLHNG